MDPRHACDYPASARYAMPWAFATLVDRIVSIFIFY